MHVGALKDKKAFTIVELLIVIVVIAILAAIVVVAYSGIRDSAQRSTLQSELSQAAKKLEAYKVTNAEQYPDSWSAAQAAGVVVGADSVAQYYGAGDVFCLELTKGSFTYSIRANALAPSESPCTQDGIALWTPLNGNANVYGPLPNTATVYGATVTAGRDGKAAGALSFDGSNDYVDFSSPYPTTNTPFSISVWAEGAPGGDWRYIARKGAGEAVGASVWVIGLQPSASNQYTFAVNGDWSAGATGVAAVSSQWHHLVLVYDGQTQRGFVDGVLRISSTIGSITNSLSGGSMTLGGVATAGYRPFLGSIDDFRIYNKALTTAEVTALYAEGAQ